MKYTLRNLGIKRNYINVNVLSNDFKRENDKINLVKCYRVGNLGEGYMGILHNIFATFSACLKLFKNKRFFLIKSK